MIGHKIPTKKIYSTFSVTFSKIITKLTNHDSIWNWIWFV